MCVRAYFKENLYENTYVHYKRTHVPVLYLSLKISKYTYFGTRG